MTNAGSSSSSSPPSATFSGHPQYPLRTPGSVRRSSVEFETALPTSTSHVALARNSEACVSALCVFPAAENAHMQAFLGCCALGTGRTSRHCDRWYQAEVPDALEHQPWVSVSGLPRMSHFCPFRARISITIEALYSNAQVGSTV